MKIESQNSIARLSFLCHITDIEIAWINLCLKHAEVRFFACKWKYNLNLIYRLINFIN